MVEISTMRTMQKIAFLTSISPAIDFVQLLYHCRGKDENVNGLHFMRNSLITGAAHRLQKWGGNVYKRSHGI